MYFGNCILCLEGFVQKLLKNNTNCADDLFRKFAKGKIIIGLYYKVISIRTDNSKTKEIYEKVIDFHRYVAVDQGNAEHISNVTFISSNDSKAVLNLPL